MLNVLFIIYISYVKPTSDIQIFSMNHTQEVISSNEYHEMQCWKSIHFINRLSENCVQNPNIVKCKGVEICRFLLDHDTPIFFSALYPTRCIDRVFEKTSQSVLCETNVNNLKTMASIELNRINKLHQPSRHTYVFQFCGKLCRVKFQHNAPTLVNICLHHNQSCLRSLNVTLQVKDQAVFRHYNFRRGKRYAALKQSLPKSKPLENNVVRNSSGRKL